jgi:CheY-like chemotaxis protein
MMNTSKARLTILVVDDEFIFRELNKKRIDDFLKERVCYDILTANGFEHALEILANRSIDLVFTDMFMNGKDDSGVCLADRIRSFNHHTKVFIVSNADLKYIKEKADDLNAQGCFQLPLRQKDLETAFRDFI